MKITLEPVRLYAVASAAAALAAYYLPSGAWPLILGVLAAVLGIGETVRAKVTPVQKVNAIEHEAFTEGLLLGLGEEGDHSV